jgi:hypothetical protein
VRSIHGEVELALRQGEGFYVPNLLNNGWAIPGDRAGMLAASNKAGYLFAMLVGEGHYQTSP